MILLALGVWLLVNGLYPFIDAGHAATTSASIADLVTHAIGLAMIAVAWMEKTQ